MTEPLQPNIEPTKPEEGATKPDATGGQSVVTYTQAQVEAVVKERLEQERRQAKIATDKAREKEQQEILTKNSEWQKLAEQREAALTKLQADLKAKELNDLKRDIGEKYQLPKKLWGRLQGETAEEIDADAAELAKDLPKPSKMPTMSPTNPGGASTGETEAQQVARIHGQQFNSFDPNWAASHGGGVMDLTVKGLKP